MLYDQKYANACVMEADNINSIAVSALDVFYLAELLSFHKNHKVGAKIQVLLTKKLHEIIMKNVNLS